MPALPHSLEYYAQLWQNACARGHGSSSCTQDDTSSTAQDKVQNGALLASGRARPPTPEIDTQRWLASQAAQDVHAINETSNQVQQDRACLEKEGHLGLSRVHFVTLSRHFRGLWPWLFLECHKHHRLRHRRKATVAVLSSHGSVFLSNCFVSSFFSRPVRNSVAAMAAWTVMDPAKEARAVLDAMAQSLLDDPSMPTPAPLQTPPADALRALMSGNIAGQAIGKGNSSEVHACQSNPRFVIRTVRQQDEVEWQRELSRLRRVPALSVITTVFATSGRSSLMPRLWPIPRGALRTTEVIRLKYDISAALEMLHRSHIVHADVHADNLMLRAEPPCFVLIDYSGCTGDSVYPLHLGYGASGYGGATHRPPTLESSPAPVRTAHGDYYRLARTILKQLYIGPEPSKRKHSDKDSSLPSHLDKELRTWLERDQWPRPPSPTSPFPPGSWKDSAISPSIILHASLCKANGEVKQDTATFTSPDCKFGNSNGTLVLEGAANDGMQGTGSWEKSAISARFFLKCQLRTCGRFARTIYQEIFPWQAYSNQDGYLVPSNPPPPPPAPSAPTESLTTEQSADGGFAHLTMPAQRVLPPRSLTWVPSPRTPCNQGCELTARLPCTAPSAQQHLTSVRQSASLRIWDRRAQ